MNLKQIEATAAKHIIGAVLKDLSGREGYHQLWKDVPVEVREEMETEIGEVVFPILNNYTNAIITHCGKEAPSAPTEPEPEVEVKLPPKEPIVPTEPAEPAEPTVRQEPQNLGRRLSTQRIDVDRL